MYAIECKDISKSFKEGPWWSKKRKVFKAVDQVSFAIEKGEVFGLLGTNGSGKSTLIRMISTLLYPDSGTLRVMGHDPVKEAMLVRQLLNRVAVDAAFFKKLSAWENLAYAARIYGLNPSHSKERIAAILSRLGLPKKKLEEPIENMSRGMQQKVAIARALITVPQILLLDEPTTGLDPVSKREVKQFIKEVQLEHCTTILLTTHDMQEAADLCGRIALMSQGKIMAMGVQSELQVEAAQDNEDPTSLDLETVFFRLTGKALNEEEESICHV